MLKILFYLLFLIPINSFSAANPAALFCLNIVHGKYTVVTKSSDLNGLESGVCDLGDIAIDDWTLFRAVSVNHKARPKDSILKQAIIALLDNKTCQQAKGKEQIFYEVGSSDSSGNTSLVNSDPSMKGTTDSKPAGKTFNMCFFPDDSFISSVNLILGPHAKENSKILNLIIRK